MPCNVGSPNEGILAISYAPATGGDVSLTCTPTTLHTLTVAKAGEGTGIVSSEPAGISCGSDCSQEYEAGRQVTLTATRTGASTFTGWSGACSGAAATCTVSMESAKEVTASFAPTKTLVVTLTSRWDGALGGYGAGTVTGPGGFTCTVTAGAGNRVQCQRDYIAGTPVILGATPVGDDTVTWAGSCTGSSRTCSLVMDGTKIVEATFTG